MVNGYKGLPCEDRVWNRELFPLYYYIILAYGKPSDELSMNMPHLVLQSTIDYLGGYFKKVQRSRSNFLRLGLCFSHKVLD